MGHGKLMHFFMQSMVDILIAVVYLVLRPGLSDVSLCPQPNPPSRVIPGVFCFPSLRLAHLIPDHDAVVLPVR
jgi:hypothetical protein